MRRKSRGKCRRGEPSANDTNPGGGWGRPIPSADVVWVSPLFAPIWQGEPSPAADVAGVCKVHRALESARPLVRSRYRMVLSREPEYIDTTSSAAAARHSTFCRRRYALVSSGGERLVWGPRLAASGTEARQRHACVWPVKTRPAAVLESLRRSTGSSGAWQDDRHGLRPVARTRGESCAPCQVPFADGQVVTARVHQATDDQKPGDLRRVCITTSPALHSHRQECKFFAGAGGSCCSWPSKVRNGATTSSTGGGGSGRNGSICECKPASEYAAQLNQ
jgi:hypothetical protein